MRYLGEIHGEESGKVNAGGQKKEGLCPKPSWWMLLLKQVRQ